ncbi:MAG: YbhB/YbcL family Raf kinase inhibitor-like protein [Bacteroidetes bacterium]|nr:YbhB/YbcL family Raf kinase inhibitor-like protein [Bacteroidota bacterium]
MSSHNHQHVLEEQSFPTFCAQLKVTSPVFEEGGMIPIQYTCDGANISPALDIEALPPGTRSLAVIMEDVDATGDFFTHWLAWNIPPVKHIAEGRKMEVEGYTDFRMRKYKGPCPPYGTHRYLFKVFALDMEISPAEDTRTDLEGAMSRRILGFGQLMGRYKRK